MCNSNRAGNRTLLGFPDLLPSRVHFPVMRGSKAICKAIFVKDVAWFGRLGLKRLLLIRSVRYDTGESRGSSTPLSLLEPSNEWIAPTKLELQRHLMTLVVSIDMNHLIDQYSNIHGGLDDGSDGNGVENVKLRLRVLSRHTWPHYVGGQGIWQLAKQMG